jgi:acetoin utilization protein AcuB/CBS domain-containing protein
MIVVRAAAARSAQQFHLLPERRPAMPSDTTAITPRHTTPAEHEIRFWMRAPAVTVNIAAPLSEALALMREHDIRRLPVVFDTGELRGIITQGDIRGADVLRAGGLDPLTIADALRQIKVYEVMTEDPITVTPMTSLREAAMLMIENKIGGLPAVDADDMVIGIITESDLFEALVQQLDRQAEEL